MKYVRIRKYRLENEEGNRAFEGTQEGNKEVICPMGEPTVRANYNWESSKYPVYVDGEVYYICDNYNGIEIDSKLLYNDEKILVKGKGDEVYTVVGSGVVMYRAENADGVQIRRNYVNKKGELTFKRYIEPNETIEVVESDGFKQFVKAVHSNSAYDREDYLPAIYKNYETAVEAKSRLREILSKHPNWNEDQQCIEVDVSFARQLDSNTVYSTLDNFCGKCEDQRVFSRTTLSQWRCVNNLLYSRTAYIEADGVIKFSNRTINSLTTDNRYTTPEVNLSTLNFTQKASRVIRAMTDLFGIKSTPEFEKSFAAVSDALSIKKKNYKLVLSINPADFVTMSHGNSWHSCHSFRDNGCYHAGCLSYALDKSTMIAYIIPADSKGDNYEVNKIARLLFMLSDDEKSFMSTRLYPNNGETAMRSVFDETVGALLKTCGIEGDLDKTYSTRTRIKTTGLHYPDYNYGYVNLFGADSEYKFTIGAKAYNFADPSKEMLSAGCCTTTVSYHNLTEIILYNEEVEAAFNSLREPVNVPASA